MHDYGQLSVLTYFFKTFQLQFRTITYTLLANTAGNNLFSMDQGTGIIRVKSALTGDPTVTFNVSKTDSKIIFVSL